ncbi:hypothetical protein COY31_01240 [Candidatus Wolfebacteria bacterium CG_4_10_14_0_2_um_filter_39_18]|uniref:Uncharacterized protein n=1 Tax=Candidatus Wolfebacteria bacterium CG_4_10_14_0_2_um_filter_39_18 TaxID=1975061 RepID=A0A2M7TG73_9BACT|nr:MAG: hypothetical protein COY31_01240 [Candidatus Wolfebacteria bacterium CG_4_10_14_0_2_um_filter_39_18]
MSFIPLSGQWKTAGLLRGFRRRWNFLPKAGRRAREGWGATCLPVRQGRQGATSSLAAHFAKRNTKFGGGNSFSVRSQYQKIALKAIFWYWLPG